MRVSRILLVVLLCALFPYSTMGVESVASDARGGTGIDISRTVKALREIKVKDLDTTVPVPARPLLTTLKHQLRDLIQETLNSKLAESADLRGVREALSAESTRQGVVAERPDIVLVRTPWTAFAYTYGNVMEIVIIH